MRTSALRIDPAVRAATPTVAQAAPAYDGRIVASVMLVCTAVFSALLMVPGKTLVTAYPHDTLLYLDGAYRLAQGQIPHRDFHMPLGALSYVFPYLGLRLSGSYGAALPTAMAIALVAVAPVAIYVLASRLRWAVAVPIGIYLSLLIAAPAVVGEPPSMVTMAMWYNRFCWALLCLLFFLYVPPRHHVAPQLAGLASRWADGLVAGLLVATMIYTKITYGLVALSFLGLWFALARENRSAALVATGVTLAAVVLVETIWRLNGPYLQDIRFALASAQALQGGLLQPLKAVFQHVRETAFVLLAALLIVRNSETPFRDLLFVGFCTAAGFVILNQNSADTSVPVIVVVLALAAERLMAPHATEPFARRADAMVFAVALLLVFAAEAFVFRGLVLTRHFAQHRYASSDLPVPAALAGLTFADFSPTHMRIRPGGTEALEGLLEPGLTAGRAFDLLRDRHNVGIRKLGTEEYILTLTKAIEVLESVGYEGRRVFVFDIINPMSFILNTPPPVGDLFCYHVGRQFGPANHQPADELFASVALVLVPTFAVEPTTRDTLMDLYGDHLRQEFRVAAESDYWTVWQRTVDG
jgi:hypothetical protein